jgi:hypothetical protein
MFRSGALALAALFLGTSCTPPSTSASTPAPLQAGQTIPISFSLDGKEVYRATLTVRNLEETGARSKDAQGLETDLVALLEKEDFVDPDFAQQRGKAAPPISYDEVIAFLDQHWDAEFGDSGDPGRNAKEFLEVLNDMEIDIPMFVNEFKKLGLSLKDYLTLISYIDGYDDLLGGNGFTEIVDSLAQHGLGLKDFLLYLEASEMTTLEFFAALIGQQQTFNHFLKESAAAEKPLPESLKALKALATQAGETFDVSEPFFYTKTWSVLEKGNATGTKGHVLNSRYGHPSWYTGGQVVTSGLRKLIVGAPENPLAHCEWKVTCRQGVTPTGASIGGRYLQDIEVQFTKIHTILGWQLNGKMVSSGAMNEGWSQAPEPKAYHRLMIIANFLFDSGYRFTDSYTISPKNGIQAPPTMDWQYVWTPFETVSLKGLP